MILGIGAISVGEALAAGPLVPTELRELNQLGNYWAFEGRRVCEDWGLVKDVNVRTKYALRCSPLCQGRPPNLILPSDPKTRFAFFQTPSYLEQNKQAQCCPYVSFTWASMKADKLR